VERGVVSDNLQLLQELAANPAAAAWFTTTFSQAHLRVMDTGEQFTLLARGDRVDVVSGWQAVPRQANSVLQRLGFDPGAWYAQQYILPLDSPTIRSLLAAFAGGMLSPEAQHRVISAMLRPLLEALYAMPAMNNRLLLKLFGIETFWQEALLDPAGNETLPITVKLTRGGWLIRPGYHGRPRHRYLIQPGHILEEQQRIHQAELVNSLAAWLALLQWYNHYRRGVATRPYAAEAPRGRRAWFRAIGGGS
jgi:hypothetical protein